MTSLVDSEALFHQAGYAIFVDIQGAAWWTNTLSVDVAHIATFDLAEFGLVALNCRISLVARQTDADHRSQWNRIDDPALGIHTTRFCRIARINTFAANASRLRGTVSVILTECVQQMAALHAITDVTRGTGALRPMVVHLTNLIAGASGATIARILAPRIDAGLVQRTIRVTSTTNDYARRLGISRVAWFALAYSSVVDAITFGVPGTGVLLAHWNALSVDACMLT